MTHECRLQRKNVPNIDKGPLVEVLHNGCQASQETFCNARQKVSIPILLGRVGQHAERLQDGHNQAPKANGTKRRGDGAQKAVVNGRTAASRLGRLVPPGADRSSHNHMNRVLIKQSRTKSVSQKHKDNTV